MKDSTRIILIVICFILVLFLIGVLVWGIVMGDFDYNGNQKIVKEEHFDMESVDEITITTRSSDIHFLETEEKEIRIVQKKSGKVKENDLFQVRNHGGVLEIEEGRNQNGFCIGFCFGRSSDYEIYIPNSYQKKMSIKTASGDVLVRLGAESFSQFHVITVSGDIHINSRVTSDSISLKSTSGDIDTAYLNGSSIYMGTVSGDIENETLEGSIEIKTTSGDVENHFVKGSTQISSVSGEVEIDDFMIEGESKITSTSGDIDVVLNRESSVKMSADSVSGDIHFPHSESVVGEGIYSLYFKTVSGDISVKTGKGY